MSTNLTKESTKAIESYLSKMKRMQNQFHEIIKEKENKEVKLTEFILHIHKSEIKENCHEFISFLHFLSQISQTHHHKPDIIKIVEDLLLIYKKDIQKHLQNGQLFSIFKNDKKILLFLYKSKILSLDQFVLFNLKSDKYSTFFFPEVKNELSEEKIEKISENITYNFKKMREQGETNPVLFDIFRNDSLKDFIKNNSSPNYSIFETNPFLIDNKSNFLEIATLFGSMKIFKHLQSKNEELTSSLWDFAINGQNLEVIKILKEKNIEPTNKTYKDLFIESLKCHDNEISNYIHDNFLQNFDLNSKEFIPFYFKYYNFEYIKTEFVDKSNINDLCLFDYPFIVDTLLKHEKEIDVNKKITVNNESLGKIEINLRKNNRNNELNSVFYEYKANIKKTPLFNAVSENNVEIAKLLLSNPNKIDLNYKYKYMTEIDIKYIIVIYFLSLLICFFPYIQLYVKPLYFFIITLRFISFILNRIKLKVCACCSLYWFYLMSFKSLNLIEFKIKEFTILHLAVENNNYEMSKLLIPMPNINVNALKKDYTRIRSKQTALYLATENNNTDIVKLLLSESKIDVNKKNIFYINRPLQDRTMMVAAIFLAILSCNLLNIIICIVFILYYLSTLPTNRNDNDISILFLSSIFLGFLLLYKYLFGIQNNAFSKIFEKVFHIILVYFIIEAFASLKSFVFAEITALNLAVFNGNIEITKLLLSANNIDANKTYNIRYHLSLYDQLSINNLNAIEEEKTPLYLAYEKNNTKIINLLLLDNKINVNIKSKFSYYNIPLSHALLPFPLTLIMTLKNKFFGFSFKKTKLYDIDNCKPLKNFPFNIHWFTKNQKSLISGLKYAYNPFIADNIIQTAYFEYDYDLEFDISIYENILKETEKLRKQNNPVAKYDIRFNQFLIDTMLEQLDWFHFSLKK